MPVTLGATILVVACGLVFARGETILQATIPALVDDLGRRTWVSTAPGRSLPSSTARA
ncbi:MAG TPA: hypothetical protein VFT70_11615 [Nocardioides sp.]|nr:hypothetical protein [Nocardioides sp.]